MLLQPIENIEELKKLQLGILKFVSNFCDENAIEFWLDAGTLLGAVRHKGFIPWDDDLDIGMTRPNYDRFIKLFNKENLENDRYSFHCVENDEKYEYQMGKVFDNRTILYEPDKKTGYKICVYIDVFVYDNIPSNPTLIKKLYDRRDFFKHIRTLQKAQIHNGNRFRQSCVHAVGKILSIIPTRYLVEKIVNNGKQYRNVECKWYGSLVGDLRVPIDKKLINSTVKIEFEGELFNIPIGYHEILTLAYGDYMTLPPIEKRISNHKFEAYYIF